MNIVIQPTETYFQHFEIKPSYFKDSVEVSLKTQFTKAHDPNGLRTSFILTLKKDDALNIAKAIIKTAEEL